METPEIQTIREENRRNVEYVRESERKATLYAIRNDTRVHMENLSELLAMLPDTNIRKALLATYNELHNAINH